MLKSGENFGHYKVNSAIGAGGMGEIYRARDTRLKRDVAIKILPEKFLKDEAAVERFMREARAASALNHPNILTIYDIGEIKKIRFIATEFVEGETIRERLKSKNLTCQRNARHCHSDRGRIRRGTFGGNRSSRYKARKHYASRRRLCKRFWISASPNFWKTNRRR